MAFLSAVNFKSGEGWLLGIFRCDVFPPIEIDLLFFIYVCNDCASEDLSVTARGNNDCDDDDNDNDDNDNDNVNHDNDDDVHIMMKFMRVCMSRWMC